MHNPLTEYTTYTYVVQNFVRFSPTKHLEDEN